MLTLPLGGARIAGRARRLHPCSPGMKHGKPWIGTLQLRPWGRCSSITYRVVRSTARPPTTGPCATTPA
jgi:hypothetical protein